MMKFCGDSALQLKEMENPCLENPPMCECSFKEKTTVNSSQISEDRKTVESRDVSCIGNALFQNRSRIVENVETLDQIDKSRLEMIFRQFVGEGSTQLKRWYWDKNNEVAIISVYPVVPNNFQELLKYYDNSNGFGTFVDGYKYVNINPSNEIPMFYNGRIQSSVVPSVITSCDVNPQETHNVNDINTQLISVASTQVCESSCIPKAEDDDVIFVKEYKINSLTSANSSTDKNKTESSSRIRTRPCILAERRRNPMRKAQMNKASIKLAENLSIPSAVFNARVTTKKTKPDSNNQISIRQSCRTTGAVLCPPTPLNHHDFKEWPAEGLHEIPSYNEQTGKIEKFSVSCNVSKNKTNTNPWPHRPENLPIKSRTIISKREKVRNKLPVLTHNRLHLMLTYAKEFQEFNNLKGDLTKNEEKENRLRKVSTLLYDTCELYSLLNNTGLLPVAKYIESINLKN